MFWVEHIEKRENVTPVAYRLGQSWSK